MIISLIVAADENNVIGNKNKLPWHLPNDLKHFRDLTKGHVIIMGRKTFESIGRPLPNRRNVIISRTLKIPPVGCEISSNLGEFLIKLSMELKNEPEKEIFIIGGADLFNSFLLGAFTSFTADRIYFTRIHEKFEGDTFFPRISSAEWKQTAREDHEPDAENPYAYSFITYDRMD